MKVFKTQRWITGIAAVAATGGFIASASGAGQFPGPDLVPNGSPDDGLVCRSGYTPEFDGKALRCSKLGQITVEFECANSKFPTLVIRFSAPSNSPHGDQDICIKSGVSITSTETLKGVPTGNYELATIKNDTITKRVDERDKAEAAALALKDSEVETRAGTPVVTVNGAKDKSKDIATVEVKHYTFALPNGGPIIIKP